MIHQIPLNSRVANAVTTDYSATLWQKSLKNAFRNPADLLAFLGLPEDLINNREINAISFPMLVPLCFAQRMKPGDASDPLLLQVLPRLNELEHNSNYSADPVGDIESMIVPGLLHKYHGRVLLTLTGACAIHCRYCFRRHFPYSDAAITSSSLNQIIDYIKNNDTINEVILSGGDPLSLSDRRLQEVIHHIESITHIKTLRIHSRLPIVLPERITAELLNILQTSRLSVVFVIHCNHPNELDQHVVHQLKKISNIGCHLLNQSVLLRDVNDDVTTLVDLSRKLFDANIMPYYLHRLDKVAGAQHFDLPHDSVKNLYLELQNQLPGYLVPKLVEEIAGMPSKIPYIR